MTKLHAQNDACERQQRFGRWAPLVWTGVIACAALWAGCSPETHYKMLSFFFDGVPDPNAPAGGAGDATLSGSAVVIVSRHPPYAENNCFACHASASAVMLTQDDSALCLRCHEKIVDQYPFMHGAVVGQACLWCHEPHESPNEHLLRQPAPAVCLQCHGDELQRRNDANAFIIPQHSDLSKSCLTCHVGHGSNAPGMLRTNAGSSETESSVGDDAP